MRTDNNQSTSLPQTHIALDQIELMRFNNNKNFEKFQENINKKKAVSSIAVVEPNNIVLPQIQSLASVPSQDPQVV